MRVSTAGYTDIALEWQQRLSASASKYLRVQYSPDGIEFTDLPGAVVSSQATLEFEAKSFSLTGVEGVNDNPQFALRIVSEFESTATGVGKDEYVTTYGTNTYTRGGTVRFDLLQISGARIAGGNTPPQVSSLGAQVLRVGQVSGPLAVSVSDFEDPPRALLVSGAAADPNIVAVTISGEASDRAVILQAGAVPGNTTVTLTVQDTAGATGSTSFAAIVLPTNTPPIIIGLVPTNTAAFSSPVGFDFVVGDLESGAECLLVTGTSANPGLVPDDAAHIWFAGAGSNRTLYVVPSAGQGGIAPITVRVSDGWLCSESRVGLLVQPSDQLLLYDSFAYSDGGICTNSGGLWRNRSGTAGECRVRQGELELTGSRTEDVVISMPGAPHSIGTGAVLYASFNLRFLQPPAAKPVYFAHLLCGTALRGRVYAAATDIWPGAFRLYVSNGSDTNTLVPWNLSTNINYRVVTRYTVDSARTVLWINPLQESDAGVNATDQSDPVAVTGYGFRQDSGLGTVLIDELRVGRSFNAVTRIASPAPQLRIRREAELLLLEWMGEGYELEVAGRLDGDFISLGPVVSPFTNVLQSAAQFFRLRKLP